MTREGSGAAPGSCGELMQGVTTDGEEFQVSLPIDVWSRVETAFEPHHVVEILGAERFPKLRQATALAIERLDLPPHRVAVKRRSDLPVAKGMGSSTADIVAAARSVADAFDRSLSSDDLATLAGALEPSDGTMYRGVVATRRRGPLLLSWPWSPSFWIVVLIPRDTAETLSTAVASISDAAFYESALESLTVAARRHDSAAFASVGATSALLLRTASPNPWTATLPPFALEVAALGWNIAHTGTVAGLLFPQTTSGKEAAIAAASAAGRAFDVETLVVRAGEMELR